MATYFQNQGEGTSVAPRVLIEQADREKAGLLEPWYRLSSPQAPAVDAELAERELYRRGRLTSTVLLIFLVLAIIFLPVAVFSSARFLLPLMAAVIVIVAISVICNRFGKITAAGVILVASVEIAFMISLRTQHGGLSVYNLPTLDMLVLPELLAVSLLPAPSVFVIALVNSVFIGVALDTPFIPRAHDLQILLAQSGYSVLIRPIIIQILVAIVTFLWVRSTQRAIARADRAEVIAQLEHAIAQQEHQAAQEKRQLEVSIQQIVQAHTQIANGDYDVRVPLTQDNVLWQIAGSLNNLLARLQRYRQDAQQNQYLLHEINRLTEEIRRAKGTRQKLNIARTGTPLDMLLYELMTPSTAAPPPDSRSRSGKLPPSF